MIDNLPHGARVALADAYSRERKVAFIARCSISALMRFDQLRLGVPESRVARIQRANGKLSIHLDNGSVIRCISAAGPGRRLDLDYAVIDTDVDREDQTNVYVSLQGRQGTASYTSPL